MPLGLRNMELGFELINLTIHFYLIKVLIGHTLYGNVQEILPDDMPDPLGEAVTTTTTMDANLNHCLANGKSLTGCLHFVNKTHLDWYSKKHRDSYTWFRDCCCQFSNRTDHGH